MSDSLQQLVRLQFKRGKDNSFNIKNYSGYVLEYGEPFFDISEASGGAPGKLYIGDGQTPLSELDPINLSLTASLIANTINNATGDANKINGDKINGAVSLANRLGDANNSKTLDDILAEAGINTVNQTGEGDVVTKVEKSGKALNVTKNLKVLESDKTYFSDITSSHYEVGGVHVGDNLSGYTIVDLIKKIFSSTVDNFSIRVNTSQVGSTITATSIVPTFTGGQGNIELKVWEDDGTPNYVVNTDDVTSGTTYTFSTPISTSTSTVIKATLTDGSTTLVATYTLAPAALGIWYWGMLPPGISRENENITSTHIVELSNSGDASIPIGNNLVLNFGDASEINCHACFAYPSSLGKLTNIYNTLEMDGLANWTDNDSSRDPLTIAVPISGEIIDYYVYVKWSEISDTDYSSHFIW